MGLFFIICTGIVILMLIYLVMSYKQQVRHVFNLLIHTENELKKSSQLEQTLRVEVQNLQIQLKRSFEDPVTQLLGWQLFEDRLSHHLQESMRYQYPLGILFVDIDNFKMINDGLSYEVGDALLKEVGARLKSAVRQVDTVSRFTKDTFVILLAQLIKPESAAIVAQRILRTLLMPFHIQGHELYITVCIGIAIAPNDGTDSAQLLRSADHALHMAKEKGHHVYQFYQEKLHNKSLRELALFNSLSKDSIFDELILSYQPIVNVKNHSLFCLDTIISWQHPQLGLINAEELFSYVEKQRKSNVISEWVLRKACTQFLRWRKLGLSPKFLGLSFSLRQFESSQFIYRIAQILQELAFKPEWLLLQIKVRSAEVPFDVFQKALNMLHYMGVNIAIANFGSSAFPLCQLKDFQFNYLELDRALHADLLDDEQAKVLVRSIIQLAHNLNLEVIAQNIESEQQKKILEELGCLLMQGDLFAKPLNENEVADNKLFV